HSQLLSFGLIGLGLWPRLVGGGIVTLSPQLTLLLKARTGEEDFQAQLQWSVAELKQGLLSEAVVVGSGCIRVLGGLSRIYLDEQLSAMPRALVLAMAVARAIIRFLSAVGPLHWAVDLTGAVSARILAILQLSNRVHGSTVSIGTHG